MMMMMMMMMDDDAAHPKNCSHLCATLAPPIYRKGTLGDGLSAEGISTSIRHRPS